MEYRSCQAPVSEKARKGWRLWSWNILVALDQLGNALLAGDAQETISSRAGKAKAKGKWWARVLCRGLDLIDRGHCEASINPAEGDDGVF